MIDTSFVVILATFNNNWRAILFFYTVLDKYHQTITATWKCFFRNLSIRKKRSLGKKDLTDLTIRFNGWCGLYIIVSLLNVYVIFIYITNRVQENEEYIDIYKGYSHNTKSPEKEASVPDTLRPLRCAFVALILSLLFLERDMYA